MRPPEPPNDGCLFISDPDLASSVFIDEPCFAAFCAKNELSEVTEGWLYEPTRLEDGTTAAFMVALMPPLDAPPELPLLTVWSSVVPLAAPGMVVAVPTSLDPSGPS